MLLNDALKHVTVVGAAGKMGSGIAQLLLQVMAISIPKEAAFQLTLIDTNESLLSAQKKYLREHITKYAERRINVLRQIYADCEEIIDNEDVVSNFVERALSSVRYSTLLEEAKGSTLIFEAIVEDIEIKTRTFRTLNEVCGHQAYYFTNTSSIPIHILAEKSHLDKRLIGFHFYNPPVMQKLLEVIIPENIDPVLVSLSKELAIKLEKKVVISKDVAGFIGNGYFIREIAFAFRKVKELSAGMPLIDAIYLINQITQEYLIRPMGIFQLLDYVGIDVCQRIAQIMNTYLPDLSFDSSLLEKMIERKIIGGQLPNGSQKNGFFRYENRSPIEIYDMEEADYIPLAKMKDQWQFPQMPITWKQLVKESKARQKEQFKTYFQHLIDDNSLGAELAKEFLKESQNIARHLVENGVAQNIEDVDTVLENGFFHLYGPKTSFLLFQECHL